MTRKEFIRLCLLLGVSVPLQSTITACGDDEETNFNGEVIIIGAGVAGLTAGYLLKQKGINFKILEASQTLGGRLKINENFTEFPIPLGAEWLHVPTQIFSDIVNNPSVNITDPTKGYSPNDSYGLYENNQLTLDTLGATDDRKFINSSWLQFYKTHITPSISAHIIYNETVQKIDFSENKSIITTQNNSYTTDKVLVTVPLQILKNNTITFTPELPTYKKTAISDASLWQGLKVFIEFSEKFYPTLTDVTLPTNQSGEKTIYDAAYGQNTTKNILGYFVIGDAAIDFLSLTDNELKTKILQELDTIFNNKATTTYIKHIAQNWSKEPHIECAYLDDDESANLVYKLFEPVSNKLYFAGEAYTTGNDWGGVHAAANAAKDAVNLILEK